jgi:uncharacterized protein (TIGR02231 family)
MKSIHLLWMLALTASCAFAQTTQKNIDSKVTKVTVFPDGAQVTRTSHVAVPAGRTDLVFTGISPYMNVSSLRVEGDGSFVIISVSPVANKLKEQKKRKDVEDLEHSKEVFKKQLIQHQASLDIYVKEEQMLEANHVVGGANTGLKATDLTAALDVHRTRLRELKYFEIDYNEKIKKVEDTLSRIDQQIQAIDANAEISTTDVIVTTQSTAGSTADFTISYVVTNAGWYPSYDLHVDDISKPLTLNYKANVHQNTGEEWKDIKIVFSNGNPNESGVAPILNPLYLYSPRGLSVENIAASAAGVTQSDAGEGLTINGGREDKVQYIVSGHKVMSRFMNDQEKSNISYNPQNQNATNITFELTQSSMTDKTVQSI